MKILKRLFGAPQKVEPTVAPGLAVAQLLLEIARSDLSVTVSEMRIIRRHLSQAYRLSETQLDTLLTQAEAHVEQSVSLHDSVMRVNNTLSAEDKNALIRTLWQVAYADQRLDVHEEALLRRLANLLHVPHSIFIREKLASQITN